MIKSGFNQLFWSKFLESNQIVEMKLIKSGLDLIKKFESDQKRLKKTKSINFFNWIWLFQLNLTFWSLTNCKVVIFDLLIKNFWSFNKFFDIFNQKCIKIDQKDQKLIEIDQKLALPFNWNPIYVVKIESDQNRHSNLGGLEFKWSTIQFISPNRLSLKHQLDSDFFLPWCVYQHFFFELFARKISLFTFSKIL